MSPYAYARFEEHGGQLFRLDTRVYLDDNQHNLDEKAECVAAIVAKNPGSAKPADGVEVGTWAPVRLDRDAMLPRVRKWFREAYLQAGKSSPTNGFVQVWNLFYLCNPTLSKACSAVMEFPEPHPHCPTESTSKPKFVWFAWGGDDDRLNAFKDRFLNQGQRNSFYYDKNSACLLTVVPNARDFAKHPQGLPALPIINHLSFLIGKDEPKGEEIKGSQDVKIA